VPQEPAGDIQRLETLSQTFRTVYQQVRPAVVLITTTRRLPSVRYFLPRFHPELPDDEESRGLGSGTIVSPDGYILSSYHVIHEADSILVTLSDRRTFEAEVVGFDSLIDIALLKIDAVDLPTVHLGDAEAMRIGDWVLAIGYPLGLGSTLTHGIVSALGRQAQVIRDEYGIESFIQTNAAINPGNSGGPLLNLDGEVVGINTAISTRTGYFIGYGLAVPINLAQEAMSDIITHGRVVRGYLGISMQEVTQDLVQVHDLGLDPPRGVYIDSLFGQPAVRGGLRPGDVILAIDALEVDLPNQVQTIIYSRDPGNTIMLTILRDGAQFEVGIVLGEREEDRLFAQGKERISRLGITVEVLSGELAEELGFTREVARELGFVQGEDAVVVVEVDPDGLAASRGIEVHDVITEIDQLRITSVRQFVRFLSGFEQGESALFWLWRPRQGIDVRALRIPE